MKRKKNVLLATLMLFSVSSQALLAALDPAQDQECAGLLNSRPGNFMGGFWAQLKNPFGIFGSEPKKLLPCKLQSVTQLSGEVIDYEKGSIHGSSSPTPYSEDPAKVLLEPAKSLGDTIDYLEQNLYQQGVFVPTLATEKSINVVKKPLETSESCMQDAIELHIAASLPEPTPVFFGPKPPQPGDKTLSKFFEDHMQPTTYDVTAPPEPTADALDESIVGVTDGVAACDIKFPTTASRDESSIDDAKTSPPHQDMLFVQLWQSEETSYATPETITYDGQAPGIYVATYGNPYRKLDSDEERQVIEYLSTHCAGSAQSILNKYGYYLTTEQRDAVLDTVRKYFDALNQSDQELHRESEATDEQPQDQLKFSYSPEEDDKVYGEKFLDLDDELGDERLMETALNQLLFPKADDDDESENEDLLETKPEIYMGPS